MEERGDSAMARTYRDIAMEEMLRTVEEAMRRVINRWEDLPPPMKDAVDQFRIRVVAALCFGVLRSLVPSKRPLGRSRLFLVVQIFKADNARPDRGVATAEW